MKQNIDKEELYRIAQVIWNKIYNENIKFYEQLAYEGKEYNYHVLFTSDISHLDIANAIMFQEDLNQINGLSLREYINMDISAFLSRVLIIREHFLSSYGEEIERSSNDLLVAWLEPIMECFTEKEKVSLKKAFLKRITNFENIDFSDDDFVDDLFFVHFNVLKREIEAENDQKLMLLK